LVKKKGAQIVNLNDSSSTEELIKNIICLNNSVLLIALINEKQFSKQPQHAISMIKSEIN
jgi:hypothetical protein